MWSDYLKFLDSFYLFICKTVLIIVYSIWNLWRVNCWVYAKNQYVAPRKHSVNANHKCYSFIVRLSKCKFLVAVVSAFPDTDGCVFSSGYAVECPSRSDPQPSSPGYHLSFPWRPHSSCGFFTCTSAPVSLQSCPLLGSGVFLALLNS